MSVPLIFLFPGQASQYVGMGKELYENCPAAAAVLNQAASLEGLSHLPDLCFNGPAELLTRTDNVQPAITAISIMALEALRDRIPVTPFACAGHSLGEYAAHYAAGNLSLPMVMELVTLRGFWMNEAAQPPYPAGSMVAVMGISREALDQVVSQIGADQLAVANLNSPGQIILSGAADKIQQAIEAAKAASAKKTVTLNVSGAWHSPLMIPAAKKMGELLDSNISHAQVTFNPAIKVIANATADYVTDAQTLRETLTSQITSPVRWEESIAKLVGDSPTPPLFVEIGPGKVLKSLLRSIDKNFEALNVEDSASLEATAARISELM